MCNPGICKPSHNAHTPYSRCGCLKMKMRHLEENLLLILSNNNNDNDSDNDNNDNNNIGRIMSSVLLGSARILKKVLGI